MEIVIPQVTEDQRSLLSRDQGAGFGAIERYVEHFLSYGFGDEAVARDHYFFAKLQAREDGVLEFEGFGLKALARVEYTKKDGAWLARYVFYAVETPLLGEPVIGAPVYEAQIDSEGFVQIGSDTSKFNLFPQIPSMSNGAIYNRLKQGLLCVAESRHN